MWPIYGFYVMLLVGIWCLFYRKVIFNRWSKPFLCMGIAIATVIVASEYWEIPIFVLGTLGLKYWWPYPSFAFLLHHIYVIIMFGCLLKLARVRFTERAVPMWLMGLLFNFILLDTLPFKSVFAWIPRLVGTAYFVGGTYFGSALVGA